MNVRLLNVREHELWHNSCNFYTYLLYRGYQSSTTIDHVKQGSCVIV